MKDLKEALSEALKSDSIHYQDDLNSLTLLHYVLNDIKVNNGKLSFCISPTFLGELVQADVIRYDYDSQSFEILSAGIECLNKLSQANDDDPMLKTVFNAALMLIQKRKDLQDQDKQHEAEKQSRFDQKIQEKIKESESKSQNN